MTATSPFVSKKGRHLKEYSRAIHDEALIITISRRLSGHPDRLAVVLPIPP
jgi:hypothetical protein